MREMTEDASSSLEQAKTQLSELAADEKGLDTKLAKKRTELERNEKRLRSLKTVRPAFMDEYEMVERELSDNKHSEFLWQLYHKKPTAQYQQEVAKYQIHLFIY